MAIAKKERFEDKGIKLKLNVPSANFPPEKIIYSEKKLVMLGKSNKEDLFPANVEDQELMNPVIEGNIGQFIYSAQNGDLYDALIYKDEVDDIILHSIRTRLL